MFLWINHVILHNIFLFPTVLPDFTSAIFQFSLFHVNFTSALIVCAPSFFKTTIFSHCNLPQCLYTSLKMVWKVCLQLLNIMPAVYPTKNRPWQILCSCIYESWHWCDTKCMIISSTIPPSHLIRIISPLFFRAHL